MALTPPAPYPETSDGYIRRTFGPELAGEPISAMLWWLAVDLQLLEQRAAELTEPQRQVVLERLLHIEFLLRAPIMAALQARAP
jgi:hypothetical protein